MAAPGHELKGKCSLHHNRINIAVQFLKDYGEKAESPKYKQPKFITNAATTKISQIHINKGRPYQFSKHQGNFTFMGLGPFFKHIIFYKESCIKSIYSMPVMEVEYIVDFVSIVLEAVAVVGGGRGEE